MQLTSSLILATAIISNVAALAQTSPNEMYITDADYHGSGCPAGSVAYDLAPDGRALTLMFDDFIVEGTNLVRPVQVRPSPINPRSTIPLQHSDHHKFCHVDLQFEVPAGWQFSIMEVGYRGYAILDQGMKAVHNSSYRFGSSLIRDTPDSDLTGPFDGDYEHFSTIPLGARSWSDCANENRQRSLTIRTSLSVLPLIAPTPFLRRANLHGLVTLDTLDGAILKDFQIQWQRCDLSVPQPPTTQPATRCGTNLYEGNRLMAVFPASIPPRQPSFLHQRALLETQQTCHRERNANQRCVVARNC